MVKNEPIRLQKFLAQCGVASRRKAEELIVQGKVKINGKTAVLGDKVNAGDKVYVKVDNTLDEPCAIVPAEASFTGEGKTLEANVPALSFTIFILEK